MKQLLLYILLPIIYLNAQTFELSGIIKDGETNSSLSYANIRIEGTMMGTSSNVDGRFSIRLPMGSYKIIASYLGYRSDTLDVNLNGNLSLEIKLERDFLELPTVTVTPGINPAIKIIKEAIKYKLKRNKKLNSYIYKAYTKALIRSSEKLSSTGNTISIGVGNSDSTKLVISGIIENESRGYFKKPDKLKEEIIARKQTSNASSSINILTGGRFIQDFYGDEVEFFNKKIMSPINESALDYYYYYLADSLAFNNKKIYKIYFNVIDENDPGFYGDLYIADSLFNLVKIDVHINSAANPGGIFTDVHLLQQFLSYGDEIFMPIDYRIKGEGNVLGLFPFGLELNSVFYDYEINPDIPDDFFDKSLLAVLPEADNKDSIYWKQTQTIPSTPEEIKAYAKFDSIKNKPKSLFENFSPISTAFKVGDHFVISGPLSLYKFNRVEGHALDFDVKWYDFYKKRFYGNASVAYGFNDKKPKWNIAAKYLFGKYRTGSLSLSVFNNLSVLFQEFDYYNELTSTILNLFYRYDFRNYFYRKGFTAEFTSEIFQVMFWGLKYSYSDDLSGIINTNFSFFYKDKSFPENKSVDEGQTETVKISANFDFRNFIEDGYFRRRVSEGKSYILLGADVLFGRYKGKQSFDFTKYHGYLNGVLFTFGSTNLQFSADVYWTNGITPFQFLNVLPGNISSSGKSNSFRTLGFGEVYGDKSATLFLEENFNDEIFRRFGIPLLNKSRLNLTVYLSAAIMEASNSLKNEFTGRSFLEFKSPFYEAGFSIGHPLFPLKFEFTWKLNYKGNNNFVFGINSVIL